jgi:hypothetical protein
MFSVIQSIGIVVMLFLVISQVKINQYQRAFLYSFGIIQCLNILGWALLHFQLIQLSNTTLTNVVFTYLPSAGNGIVLILGILAIISHRYSVKGASN